MIEQSFDDSTDDRNRRRRLPLIISLIGVALFDVIVMTSISSLDFHAGSLILAMCYLQSLISATWLASGFGKLGGRSLIAMGFLVATIATIWLHLANAIGVRVLAGFEEWGEWFVAFTVIFTVGMLVHWMLCLFSLLIARCWGWRLEVERPGDANRHADIQFGIREIMIWTAIIALLLAAARGVLRFTDWSLSDFEYDEMLLSVTYSVLIVPLQLLVMFGLLTGRRVWLRLVVVACCGTALAWLAVETIVRIFADADRGDFVVFYPYLLGTVLGFVAVARYSGLRMTRGCTPTKQ